MSGVKAEWPRFGTRRGAHELLLGLLVLLSLQAAPPETVGSVGDVSHYERDALKCLS
jgi:hypothetical protein